MSDFSSSAPAGDTEMQDMLRAEMQKAQINSQVSLNQSNKPMPFLLFLIIII